ncbi:putative microtubule associated protein [Venturia nashicola]|uniref:Putative microtubule associated protein n=1 Tax=Venturia nashicola TaxID=86259 RepID=A0A4Z1P4G5_9PEZI|nr:putative microtubule associated protein [Venturia nashicola]
MDTSYLQQQVSTIINKLHELFDEIGIPSHERDSRESELFAALSETLHNQLKLVTNEKHEMAEEADHLLTTIKQMQISLEGPQNTAYDDDELKVTYPLKTCLEGLKERHKMVGKLHRERFQQVKKLADAIESYSSHLEPSFSKLKLPPTAPNATCPPDFDISHAYFSALDDEFTRVYDEYERRLATVKSLCNDIINFWGELGTPQAQIDSNIVSLSREAPEQLGLHTEDLKRLQAKRDRLSDEKKGRERRLKDLRTQIESLWERLGVQEPEQRQFLASNRGCGMRTINEYEDELARLNELKRQNLGLFVEDSRVKLQELWDSLYFSEEEMLEFTPAFSDVYSDALLSAHESEIARLEALREQRAPTLTLIDRHKALVKERDDLANSSQDASRLMLRGQKGEKRDPGKLLREEKSRKRIAKELPKVEETLRKTLEAWENEYGRPFLVWGDRYLDNLASAQSKAVPPRSKTPAPSAPSTTTKTTTTKVPLKSENDRASTFRGAPRARTPTNFGTAPRGGFSSSMRAPDTAKSNKSPSRIPGRAPLGNMPTGNNSPERKYHMRSQTIDMGPPRAAPPKMQDIFKRSMATPQPRDHSYENVERSASIIRQMAPEDPYYDRSGAASQASHSSRQSQFSQSSRPAYSSHHSSYSTDSGATHLSSQQNGGYPGTRRHPNGLPHFDYPKAPPSRPESRQISGNSTASTTTASSVQTGSENWETYDDVSEVEAENDATDAYYAKVRAAQSRSFNKRSTPEGGWQSAQGHHQRIGKKVRGPTPNAGREVMMVEDSGEVVRGRESWSDEEGF